MSETRARCSLKSCDRGEAQVAFAGATVPSGGAMPRDRMTAIPVRRDKAAHFQRVQAPPGQPLQPEATGAGMEVTKCLKPSDSRHVGDGASERAATRVNAEQSSKRSMCRSRR